jgi:hypothetical protein
LVVELCTRYDGKPTVGAGSDDVAEDLELSGFDGIQGGLRNDFGGTLGLVTVAQAMALTASFGRLQKTITLGWLTKSPSHRVRALSYSTLSGSTTVPVNLDPETVKASVVPAATLVDPSERTTMPLVAAARALRASRLVNPATPPHFTAR